MWSRCMVLGSTELPDFGSMVTRTLPEKVASLGKGVLLFVSKRTLPSAAVTRQVNLGS